jgi:hypothetical protein
MSLFLKGVAHVYDLFKIEIKHRRAAISVGLSRRQLRDGIQSNIIWQNMSLVKGVNTFLSWQCFQPLVLPEKQQTHPAQLLDF